MMIGSTVLNAAAFTGGNYLVNICLATAERLH